MTSARLYTIRSREPGVDSGGIPGADDATQPAACGGLKVQVEDYIRRHPAAALTIAAGIGMLLPAALRAMAHRSGMGTGSAGGARLQSGRKTGPAPGQRTHDVGAAEMEFTTHHPDGKDIIFRFVWKKRPVDAAEADWPVDQMGFSASRPNGKHTAFTFTRKTRPIPPGYGDLSSEDHRPGLGRATMEFSSSHPDRQDFTFTWRRTPPGSEPPASDD